MSVLVYSTSLRKKKHYSGKNEEDGRRWGGSRQLCLHFFFACDKTTFFPEKSQSRQTATRRPQDWRMVHSDPTRWICEPVGNIHPTPPPLPPREKKADKFPEGFPFFNNKPSLQTNTSSVLALAVVGKRLRRRSRRTKITSDIERQQRADEDRLRKTHNKSWGGGLPERSRYPEMHNTAGGFSHHVGGENQDPLVFTARPLWVVQQVGVVLAELPQLVPCGEGGGAEGEGGVVTLSRLAGSRQPTDLCPSCSGCCWRGPN